MRAETTWHSAVQKMHLIRSSVPPCITLIGLHHNALFIFSCVKDHRVGGGQITERMIEVDKGTTDKTHFLILLWRTSLDYKDRIPCKDVNGLFPLK